MAAAYAGYIASSCFGAGNVITRGGLGNSKGEFDSHMRPPSLLNPESREPICVLFVLRKNVNRPWNAYRVP